MDDRARREIISLYERNKRLDPHDVVAAARPKASPLHPYFDWKDSEAAASWRLHQARQLIRVWVTIIPQVSNGPVKTFVSLSSMRKTGTGSYLATVDVVTDEQRRRQALADALQTLRRLEERFRYLPELTPVWEAMAVPLATIERQAA